MSEAEELLVLLFRPPKASGVGTAKLVYPDGKACGPRLRRSPPHRRPGMGSSTYQPRRWLGIHALCALRKGAPAWASNTNQVCRSIVRYSHTTHHPHGGNSAIDRGSGSLASRPSVPLRGGPRDACPIPSHMKRVSLALSPPGSRPNASRTPPTRVAGIGKSNASTRTRSRPPT